MSVEGYAQWIHVSIENLTGHVLKVQNASLKYGKFYHFNDKNDEIKVEYINKEAVQPRKFLSLASCGRESSASGTEGSFELFNDTEKVCRISWDCPWAEPNNTFSVTEIDPGYVIQNSGGGSTGAIGTVNVKIVQMGADEESADNSHE